MPLVLGVLRHVFLRGAWHWLRLVLRGVDSMRFWLPVLFRLKRATYDHPVFIAFNLWRR